MAMLCVPTPSDVVALPSPSANNGFPQRANKSARNRTQPLPNYLSTAHSSDQQTGRERAPVLGHVLENQAYHFIYTLPRP